MARRGTLLFSRLLSTLLSTSALAACASSTSAGDAGGGDGGPPVACGTPDTVCPPEVPFTSAPCEGTLDCDYMGTYQASCVDGGWSVVPLCDGPPGTSCVAPLVEDCDVPFAGALTGATVTIGPPGEQRAFADDELVMVEHGAQGLSMIEWALHVEGVEVPPDCVRARVSFVYEGAPSPVVAQPTTLHCGDAYPTFNVLPDRPCEARIYALEMTVDVDGVGSAHARLRLMGGLCPR